MKELWLRLVGDLPFPLAEPLRWDDPVNFLELPWMCSLALGHICAGRSFGRLFENLAFGPHLLLLSKSGSSSIHSAFFLPPRTWSILALSLVRQHKMIMIEPITSNITAAPAAVPHSTPLLIPDAMAGKADLRLQLGFRFQNTHRARRAWI